MPGLREYQLALADAVSGVQLSADDEAVLRGLSRDGIAMMARTRRAWCMGRARRAAPLTLSAVPRTQREAMLADWVMAGGGAGSFFDDEAVALLDFIATRLKPGSHAMSFARFERAVIRARAASWAGVPGAPLERSAIVLRALNADLVALRAPISDLLAAIEGIAPWPEPGREVRHLLIAPGIDGLIREASEREVALWDAAEHGVFANRDLASASALLDCGALVVLPTLEPRAGRQARPR